MATLCSYRNIMEQISHYFSAGTWYQNIFIYCLLAGLVYANIVLIKMREKKKAGISVRKRDNYRDA